MQVRASPSNSKGQGHNTYKAGIPHNHFPDREINEASNRIIAQEQHPSEKILMQVRAVPSNSKGQGHNTFKTGIIPHQPFPRPRDK